MATLSFEFGPQRRDVGAGKVVGTGGETGFGLVVDRENDLGAQVRVIFAVPDPVSGETPQARLAATPIT